MGSWSVVSTELGGTIRAFLEPSELAWTRRWNGGAELAFTLPVDDPNAGELLLAERAITAYQDGELRFRGRIHAPLRRTSQTITVRAADPWFDLAYRQKLLAGQLVYTGVDAGALAWALIAEQNARWTTRIVQGTIEPSVPRDRTYEPGKQIDEAIVQLSEVESGFGFRFDPVPDAGAFVALQVFYPPFASDRPNVRFEYGAGTLANLEDFLEEQTIPTNFVRASSAPDATGSRTEVIVGDSASRARFDEFQIDLPMMDENADQSFMASRARAARMLEPPTVWAITPGPDAPLLGRDFDAGDTCRITLRHGAVDVDGTALVSEATLQVSNATGQERLSALTLTDPQLVRTLRTPSDRLYEKLSGLRQRIGVLERTPFLGV